MQRNNWQLLQRHCWDWRHVMSTWTGSCFDFPFVWTRCEFRLALNKFKMLWTISYNQKFSVLNYNFYIDICSQERSTTLYRICFFFISKISDIFLSKIRVFLLSEIRVIFRVIFCKRSYFVFCSARFRVPGRRQRLLRSVCAVREESSPQLPHPHHHGGQLFL